MVLDPEEFKKRVFKAAQRPALWLHSAERLRDAAEAILKHELPAAGPYFQALKIAEGEAAGNDAGRAEIKARFVMMRHSERERMK